MVSRSPWSCWPLAGRPLRATPRLGTNYASIARSVGAASAHDCRPGGSGWVCTKEVDGSAARYEVKVDWAGCWDGRLIGRPAGNGAQPEISGCVSLMDQLRLAEPGSFGPLERGRRDRHVSVGGTLVELDRGQPHRADVSGDPVHRHGHPGLPVADVALDRGRPRDRWSGRSSRRCRCGWFP